jgi:hypothetical protein
MALNKNSKVLEFLLTKLSPEDDRRISAAAILGDIEIFRNNTELCCDRDFFPNCTLAGRQDILEEAELRGISWHRQENFIAGLIGGHVKLLNWLFEKDPPENRDELLNSIAEISAELGELKTLQWLRGIPDFKWTDDIAAFAGVGGHVHILDYVCENDLPINLQRVCEGAARGTDFDPGNEGNLRVMKWLRKKNTTFNFFSEELVQRASQRRDHKILRWLLIHGYISPEHQEIFSSYSGDWIAGKMQEEEFQNFKYRIK